MDKKNLLIDNYDSFTYNIFHLLRELGENDIAVVRNDHISIADAQKFDRIILSPGPGIPSEAGRMPEIVKALAPTHLMIGICLGHQCIGEVFGGKLKRLSSVIHGKACDTAVTGGSTLFQGVPATFKVGRYHSWVVDKDAVPAELKITACDPHGEIMAIEHVTHKVFGVQFHPESMLTDHGKTILKNFLEVPSA